MTPCSNSYSEEEQQPAGLCTAESPSPSSTMKREGGNAYLNSNTSKSNPIEKGGSNITTQFKKISLGSGPTESALNKNEKQPSLSLSISSSKSLTNSAPTILVHTPDTNSYQRVNRPLRSAMSSRTLHDSLHRGFQAGQGGEKGTMSSRSRSRSVSFVNVNIREYERILGDNPSCTSGPPLSIGWKHAPSPIVVSVDDYEDGKDEPRSSANFLVPKAIRERILKEHACVTRKEIVGTVRSIKKQKSQRRKTVVNLGMQGTEEKVERVRRTAQKAVGKRKSYSKNEKKLWDDAHERAVEKAKDLEESIRRGESISVHNVYSVGTPANCMLPSRRNSGEYHHLIAKEKHVKPDQRLSEEEAKEEEEAPSSSEHEVVEVVGRGTKTTQEPGLDPLRRSIVICEEDDEIFDKLFAGP